MGSNQIARIKYKRGKVNDTMALWRMFVNVGGDPLAMLLHQKFPCPSKQVNATVYVYVRLVHFDFLRLREERNGEDWVLLHTDLSPASRSHAFFSL